MTIENKGTKGRECEFKMKKKMGRQNQAIRSLCDTETEIQREKRNKNPFPPNH